MSSVGFLEWHEELQIYCVPVSERFFLSPLLPGDVDALVAIFSDTLMLPWYSRQPVPYTAEYARSVIGRNADLEGFYLRVRSCPPGEITAIPDRFWGCVRDRDYGNRVVATIDISERERRPGQPFIGFFLDCSLHGRGIMSAAVSRLLEARDFHNGRTSIYALSRADNAGSIAIQRRFGFVEQENFDVQYPPDKGNVVHTVIEYARVA